MTSPSEPDDSDDAIFEMAELFAVVAAREISWVALHNFFHKLALGLESHGWKKGQPMSQNQKLLNSMRDGRTVSRLTAMHMGVMNLTARISDLRSFGHDVRCEMKTDTEGNQYGSFSLAP